MSENRGDLCDRAPATMLEHQTAAFECRANIQARYRFMAELLFTLRDFCIAADPHFSMWRARVLALNKLKLRNQLFSSVTITVLCLFQIWPDVGVQRL